MAAPPLRSGLGKVSLKITARSDQAQKYFSQGLALTHCFWDFEAYRAFKEAARLDPDAPMAYWGIVQSIDNYKAMDPEKQAALAKIKELLPKASQHEQFYLRALEHQEEKDGHDAYTIEMERLIDAYPDDVDARLMLAISSKYGYDDQGRPEKGALYAESLVEGVLAQDPANAAANHYLIHILEAGPHADRALHAAEALGGLAPSSGHMVHMPGHIFYKLGEQEKAREAFLASMRVDEDYMRSEHVSTTDDWNYAHNLSYLVASDAEAGRYSEAKTMAAKIDALEPNPFLAAGKPMHALTVGGTMARLDLRFSNWQAVIDHPIGIGGDQTAGPAARSYRDCILAYARGMKAVENRRFDDAAREGDHVDALVWRLKANEESDDGNKQNQLFALIETASLDLRGNLECARGNLDAGFALLEKAVAKEKLAGYNEPPQYSRPELESLGYARLRAGHFEKARQAFEDELKQRPHSGHALYGIALVAETAGRKEEAAQAYRRFLAAWKNADPDLAMLRHARTAGQPQTGL